MYHQTQPTQCVSLTAGAKYEGRGNFMAWRCTIFAPVVPYMEHLKVASGYRVVPPHVFTQTRTKPYDCNWQLSRRVHLVELNYSSLIVRPLPPCPSHFDIPVFTAGNVRCEWVHATLTQRMRACEGYTPLKRVVSRVKHACVRVGMETR